MPPEFYYRGPALLNGECVEIVDWSRPYGIPYAHLKDGREVHQSQLEVVLSP